MLFGNIGNSRHDVNYRKEIAGFEASMKKIIVVPLCVWATASENDGTTMIVFEIEIEIERENDD